MEPVISNDSGAGTSASASAAVRTSTRVRHKLSYRRMLRGELVGELRGEREGEREREQTPVKTVRLAAAAAARATSTSPSCSDVSARSSMRSSLDNSTNTNTPAATAEPHDASALPHVGTTSTTTATTTTATTKDGTPVKTREPVSPTHCVARRPTTGERDTFCWMCHRDGGRFVGCSHPHCWRVYHLRCLPPSTCSTSMKPAGLPTTAAAHRAPSATALECTSSATEGLGFDGWVCAECETIAAEERRSEGAGTCAGRSSALCAADLQRALRAIIDTLHTIALKELSVPVEEADVPDYYIYIRVPMDLSTIDKNAQCGKYRSGAALLADVKWILHNSLVFNGRTSQLSSNARHLVNTCKSEVLQLSQLEDCPECFIRDLSEEPDIFCQPCSDPHVLVWARVKGFPLWPAKVLSISSSSSAGAHSSPSGPPVERAAPVASVRFFGASHERATLALAQCLLLSREVPVPVRLRTSEFEHAVCEVKTHIARLREKFGYFEFAPSNVALDECTARYFQEILTDASVRNTFATRFPQLVPVAVAAPGLSPGSSPIQQRSMTPLAKQMGSAPMSSLALEAGAVPLCTDTAEESEQPKQPLASRKCSPAGATEHKSDATRKQAATASNRSALPLPRPHPHASPVPKPSLLSSPAVKTIPRLWTAHSAHAIAHNKFPRIMGTSAVSSLKPSRGKLCAHLQSSGVQKSSPSQSAVNTLKRPATLMPHSNPKQSIAGGISSAYKTSPTTSVRTGPATATFPASSGPVGRIKWPGRQRQRQRRLAPRPLPTQVTQSDVASAATAAGAAAGASPSCFPLSIATRALDTTPEARTKEASSMRAEGALHATTCSDSGQIAEAAENRVREPQKQQHPETALSRSIASTSSSATSNDATLESSCSATGTASALRTTLNQSSPLGAPRPLGSATPTRVPSIDVEVGSRCTPTESRTPMSRDGVQAVCASRSRDTSVEQITPSAPKRRREEPADCLIVEETEQKPDLNSTSAQPAPHSEAAAGELHTAEGCTRTGTQPEAPQGGHSGGEVHPMLHVRNLVEHWLRGLFDCAMHTFPFEAFAAAMAPLSRMTSSAHEAQQKTQSEMMLEKRVNDLEEELTAFKWLHAQAVQQLNQMHLSCVMTERDEAERARALLAGRRQESASSESTNSRKKICTACGREAHFQCCANASYCEPQCQLAHWPTHLPVCSQIIRPLVPQLSQPQPLPPPPAHLQHVPPFALQAPLLAGAPLRFVGHRMNGGAPNLQGAVANAPPPTLMGLINGPLRPIFNFGQPFGAQVLTVPHGMPPALVPPALNGGQLPTFSTAALEGNGPLFIAPSAAAANGALAPAPIPVLNGVPTSTPANGLDLSVRARRPRLPLAEANRMLYLTPNPFIRPS